MEMRKSWWVVAGLGICMVFASNASVAGAVGGLVLADTLEARGMALGDAQTGMADVAAFQVNPAAIAGIAGSYASAFFKPEPLGVNTGCLRYAAPTSIGSFAGQVAYRTMGDMTFTTASGEEKTLNAGTDIIVGLSYGRVVGPVNAGATVKFLSSKLVEKYSASSIALDLGGSMKMPVKGLAVGLAVRNLGTGLKYLDESESIPMEGRLGGSYDMAFGDIGVLGALDAIYGLAAGEFGVGVGVEGTWKQMLSARVGYRTGSALKGIALGVGFTWQDTRLDYAIQPNSESFGISHAVSISYRFSGGK